MKLVVLSGFTVVTLAAEICSNPASASRYPHRNQSKEFVIQSDNAAHPLPKALKGSTMTPQFLRHEAARFRGMAEDADRQATKERFLAMAADYEARAKIAHESEEPNSGEADEAMTDPDPVEPNGELVEPTQDKAAKITLGRKIATGSKETVVIQRRPTGRLRRE